MQCITKDADAYLRKHLFSSFYSYSSLQARLSTTIFIHSRLKTSLTSLKMHKKNGQKQRGCHSVYASSRARTPGSCFPSRSSKLAPPPVEMWLILSASPTFSTAATESPPPMIVVTPLPLRSASFLAIDCKENQGVFTVSRHK